MASDLSPLPAGPARPDLSAVRGGWAWLLALGGVLVLAGMLAVSMAFVATLATVVVIAATTLVGGFLELASAVWARRWQGVVLHVVVGALYVVAGFLMLNHPVQTAEAFTLLMAALFLVGGLFRVAVAVALRFHHWGWAALSGVVSVVLGVLIWRAWPESSFWVIGTFVGIDLLVTGWTWVMLALALRSLPAER
mgnify:CR=1 FL=1